MLSDNTYIKLYRGLQNWRWYKDGNTTRLYIHLLMNANISSADFEDITIQRGEMVTSYNSLSKDLGLSVRNVRTALNHLKSTNDVTSRSTSKFTIITVTNYDKFQGATIYPTNERQASDKRPTTNRQQYNNNREEKEEKDYLY